MKEEYYTVVYGVTGDKSIHEAWWARINSLFRATGPVRVVGVSVGDLQAEKMDEEYDDASLPSFNDVRGILKP